MSAYLKLLWYTPVDFGDLLIFVVSVQLFQYLGGFTLPLLREWWRDWRNR